MLTPTPVATDPSTALLATPTTLPRVPQGRKAVITSDELIAAALKLVGPHRSISTISLREVAREAGIAPNSFYRHFRDMDELAIALIELAGSSLRKVFSEARQHKSLEPSIVQISIGIFMDQLHSGDGYLPILLREGKAGSAEFKEAVERQLVFFEDELQQDLIRIDQANGNTMYQPALAARAITRLVFTMASVAMDLPPAEQEARMSETIAMIRMILEGARALAKK
ncbi:HTH-type transcriptional repressor FabR [Aquirhabdus parva]|uniref:HTH-type transcriptional repressor FabR n=1 Tax=Aquirhabdus parva TaxID=2283318 RepID=A0A345PA53_9GAMM|nr:HTH-type transcriptional repressor FabR [Aquirhabdus parva]AXI04162.1 HTH-type transcriptional repressor FabR [Aquirhabdus parva]